MPILSDTTLVELLAPYVAVPQRLLPSLAEYLDLLVRWNLKTNLTAIRNPEEMVRRHFGESLFAGTHLGEPLPATLLDLGSGAGFPGLPIAMLHPEIAVTLAESQNKKTTFLREAVRTLGLKNVEIWGQRAELLAPRRFHTVTLRAVDKMESALEAAALLAENQVVLLAGTGPATPPGFRVVETVAIPKSDAAMLYRAIPL